MKAELKRLHSPDILNLESFETDQQDFSFLIQAFIGPLNEDGEESFDFLVCTPEWINTTVENELSVWAQDTLIIKEYNLHIIKEKINSIINSVSGDDWEDLANKIDRFAKWEFRDYESFKNV